MQRSAPDIGAEIVALLPRLRRYAIALSRSGMIADDLVQTACLRALANAASWQPGTRMDAWIFRIIRNLWLDMRRQASRRGEEDVRDGTEFEAAGGETHAFNRLVLSDVAAAIRRLPADHQEVLLLVCVEELTYREASEVLDVPIGTVMSRLARARERLNSILDGPPSDKAKPGTSQWARTK